MDERPNQVPLIHALQDTVQFLEAQSGAATPQQAAKIGSQHAQPQRHRWLRRGLPPGLVPGTGGSRSIPSGSASASCSTNAAARFWCARRTAARCCWSADECLYNPRLRRAYRIDGGRPVLLVDEAVDVTDDAEHQRLIERAQRVRSARQVTGEIALQVGRDGLGDLLRRAAT